MVDKKLNEISKSYQQTKSRIKVDAWRIPQRELS